MAVCVTDNLELAQRERRNVLTSQGRVVLRRSEEESWRGGPAHQEACTMTHTNTLMKTDLEIYSY